MTNTSGSINRLFEILGYLVDDRVGIIRLVEELPRDASEPRFFHFAAQASNTRAFTRQSNFGKTGGASADRGIALAKAVGEAVERYCSAIYDTEDLPLMSFNAAPFRCVPPEEFALYSNRQYSDPEFPYRPFDRSTSIRWAPAQDLISGEMWHVPAAMVFLPYYYAREDGEEPIVQPISTGLACHCSIAEASTSALCEAIERDAFTLTWQARLSLPKLQMETLSDCNRDIIRRLERVGSKVFLIDITLDSGIPTILGVLRAESSEAPALVFAASADLDPERAVRKSLEELAHTRQLAQELKSTLDPILITEGYKSVVHQDDHVLLYCDHSNIPLADFIFSSEEYKSFGEMNNLATGEPERDLTVLAERLYGLGYRVLIANATTPDVGELGLSVVRGIIPGFHPLFMGHRLRALGGTRLWTVPQKLGYRGVRPDPGDNPAPHPYP
jgi:ribosomal protein S12 methylthiotransferase accessory factor